MLQGCFLHVFLNVISYKIIIYDSQFKKILFMAKKTIEKVQSGQDMELKSKSKCFSSPAVDFGAFGNTYNLLNR